MISTTTAARKEAVPQALHLVQTDNENQLPSQTKKDCRLCSFAAGATAGCTSVLVGQPFDTYVCRSHPFCLPINILNQEY